MTFWDFLASLGTINLAAWAAVIAALITSAVNGLVAAKTLSNSRKLAKDQLNLSIQLTKDQLDFNRRLTRDQLATQASLLRRTQEGQRALELAKHKIARRETQVGPLITDARWRTEVLTRVDGALYFGDPGRAGDMLKQVNQKWDDGHRSAASRLHPGMRVAAIRFTAAEEAYRELAERAIREASTASDDERNDERNRRLGRVADALWDLERSVERYIYEDLDPWAPTGPDQPALPPD